MVIGVEDKGESGGGSCCGGEQENSSEHQWNSNLNATNEVRKRK